MTEMELLIDLHADAFRQGPGSTADTLRALGFMDINKTALLKIADIGCGTGAQTLVLAQNLNCRMTAVDLFPQFLLKLEARARELKLSDKISIMENSMDDLPFGDGEYDILWSEGAIYNIGFDTGVKTWKRFLKPGGFLAVSEITWKTEKRPAEIDEHWKREYPGIGTASEKVRILEESGYSPAGFFFLPEASWIDNYYSPMEMRFQGFLKKHHGSKAAENIVENERKEIELFRSYKDYFGYGFYMARKI